MHNNDIDFFIIVVSIFLCKYTDFVANVVYVHFIFRIVYEKKFTLVSLKIVKIQN